MSYMTLTCHWCGQEYSVGVVGQTMVGRGHTCHEPRSCQTPGCADPAKFVVQASDHVPTFSCKEHINDRIIIAVQS